MDLMQAVAYMILLLTLIFTIIGEITALPARQPDALLNNLKSGYYFIDNGSITPVNSNGASVATAQRPPAGKRRQDTFGNTVDANNLPVGVKFTPLVRYKQTKTHRKKLFVPNFFG